VGQPRTPPRAPARKGPRGGLLARARAWAGRTLLWAGVAAVAALGLVNGSVGLLGESVVFPLSPYFLREKVHALRTYARHRAGCLLSGHPPLPPLLAEAERRHRLPAGLLAALVQVESEGRPHRISPAGAMGPGQLMPLTARDLGVADPFEPEAAVDGSARYLARQLARFRRVDLALSAYNAGPGSVSGEVPRNGQTEHYVRKVLAAWRAAGGRATAGVPPPPPALRPSALPPPRGAAGTGRGRP
jgi:hypothetical protein